MYEDTQNFGLLFLLIFFSSTKVILWPAKAFQPQSGSVTHCHTAVKGMGIHVVYLSARYRIFIFYRIILSSTSNKNLDLLCFVNALCSLQKQSQMGAVWSFSALMQTLL